jgi:hypothetical protein
MIRSPILLSIPENAGGCRVCCGYIGLFALVTFQFRGTRGHTPPNAESPSKFTFWNVSAVICIQTSRPPLALESSPVWAYLWFHNRHFLFFLVDTHRIMSDVEGRALSLREPKHLSLLLCCDVRVISSPKVGCGLGHDFDTGQLSQGCHSPPSP